MLVIKVGTGVAKTSTAYKWIEFFDIVCSITRDIEHKIHSTSPHVLENLSARVEHCIRAICQINSIVQEVMNEESNEHLNCYVMLCSGMEFLLELSVDKPKSCCSSAINHQSNM